MAIVKLKDIASRCGVSVSTVSRILSSDTTRKISSETTERVKAAASEMGYFSDHAERALKLAPAINVACIFVSDHESIVSPFFSEILKGIQDEMELIQRTRNVTYRLLMPGELNYEKLILSGIYHIAIVLGRASKRKIDFIRENIPISVYAGLNSIGGMDEVLCNARDGIRDAVSYFVTTGATKIAYIGPLNEQNELFNEHRYRGFTEGLAFNGLEKDSSLTADVYLTAKDGYRGAEKIFSSSEPDAIVCANDIVATGVLKFLKEKNIRVPEDVMLSGFDNIESSAFLSPSLTTFDVPKSELGRFAVKDAFDLYDNPREFSVTISIPYKLIERESTRRS